MHARKVLTPLVVFKEDTLYHNRYIKEVLLVALRYGNKVIDNYWTFYQDKTRLQVHRLTQKWCLNHFSSFVEEDWWPSNSSDLDFLDYCIWDEVVKAMNWAQVLTKQYLIDELHYAKEKPSTRKLFLKIATLGLDVCGKFQRMMEIT